MIEIEFHNSELKAAMADVMAALSHQYADMAKIKNDIEAIEASLVNMPAPDFFPEDYNLCITTYGQSSNRKRLCYYSQGVLNPKPLADCSLQIRIHMSGNLAAFMGKYADFLKGKID